MSDQIIARGRIDGVEFETRLDQDVLTPGEPVSGEMTITGGDRTQELPPVGLNLWGATPDEDNVDEVGLNGFALTPSTSTIDAGETRTIPFEAPLFPEVPVTELDVPTQKTSVEFRTTLIDDEVELDEQTSEPLRVAPTDPIATTIEAAERLGLELYQSTADAGMVTIDDREARVGFDQELDFRETSTYDGPQFEEYQLHFVPRPLENMTQVLIEVERDDDVFRTMTIDHVLGYSVDTIASELREELKSAA